MTAPSFTIPALPCASKTAGRIDRSKPKRLKLVGYYTKGKHLPYSTMKSAIFGMQKPGTSVLVTLSGRRQTIRGSTT